MSERTVLFIGADRASGTKLMNTLKNGNSAAPEGLAETAIGFDLDWVRVEALFDGLRELQERKFDLILSDLFLPDGQGLATLRHLQQHAPLTPVIALCHLQDRDTGVHAVRKGAYDFFCYEDLDTGNLRKSIASAMDHASVESQKKAAAERRVSARFPCRLAVSYQTLEQPILSGQGTSETLNISSKGLLFTSNERFEPGQLVQVALDWPARLENQVLLKLVAEGRIVRNSNGQTAMTIDKYEFRTRRTVAKSTAAGAAQETTSHPEEAAKRRNSRPDTAAGSGTNGAMERPTN